MSEQTHQAVWWAGVLVAISVLAAGTPTAAQNPPVPPGSPIPAIMPPAPIKVGPGLTLPAAGALVNTAPQTPVHVASVAVEGVTVYRPDIIAALIGNLVGAAVPLARIEEARLALLRHYRNDGYPLVRVDSRLDRTGALRFVVTEGRIVAVKLDGDIGPVGTKVLAILNHLTEKTAIDVATLERYLLLAQDIPRGIAANRAAPL